MKNYASKQIRAIGVWALLATTVFLLAQPSGRATKSAPQVNRIGDVYQPLRIVAKTEAPGVFRVDLNQAAILEMAGAADVRMAFPISDYETLELELEPVNIISSRTRFVSMSGGTAQEIAVPEILALRGKVAGEPNSHAYLSFSDDLANGYIVSETGASYFLSRSGGAEKGALITATPDPRFEVPEGVEFCGVADDPAGFDHREYSTNGSLKRGSGVSIIAGAPKVAKIAIDADQEFVQMFANDAAASAYIAMLTGAVSDVYERDVDTRFELVFVRLWSAGGEPFDQTSLSSFRDYWQNDDAANLAALDPAYVHLFSGRRDLPFGGVGYINDACAGPGEWSFGISGYLNGAFVTPLEEKSLNNWDVTVVAHEMGHNSGTGHTHDDYTPTIDDCGNGVPTVGSGTIMSYCHIHTGYMTNIEVRFHRLVQEKMQTQMDLGGCLSYDCNGNGIPDSDDILGGEPDTNVDGIPDVCQDCDSDGTPDFDEINNLGEPDINGNGIPDVCESDCNGNSLPDEWEIENSMVADGNGNNVPDVCDPDCQPNGIPDWQDILNDPMLDQNRNGTLDQCEDCNSNSTNDVVDLDHGLNFFVGDLSSDVREYNARSGWPIQQYAVPAPRGVAAASDRKVYIANNFFSAGGDAIYIATPGGAVASLVPANNPPKLVSPSDILTGPGSGELLLLDRVSVSVQRYQTNGAYLGEFADASADGVVLPYAMTWGPDNNLYIASGDARVMEYDGSTGAFLGEFVGAPCCDLAGDADNSGAVNIADATFTIARIFLDGPASPCAAEGDADGSGSINIADVTYLIQLIFNAGPAPVCGPETGNGGLSDPRGMVFTAAGDLLVTSYDQGRILQFDGTTGAYLKDFNDLQDISNPWGIELGPNGNIFVVRASGVPRILEYVPEGRYHRFYIRNEADMVSPTDLTFVPATTGDSNSNGILDACE